MNGIGSCRARDLEGPGIRIVMEDSEQYADGQNINNFIIHNSDVLQIINDLKGQVLKGLLLMDIQYLGTQK